jgi:hypothetical protein
VFPIALFFHIYKQFVSVVMFILCGTQYHKYWIIITIRIQIRRDSRFVLVENRVILADESAYFRVIIPALQIIQSAFGWLRFVTLAESKPIVSVKINYNTRFERLFQLYIDAKLPPMQGRPKEKEADAQWKIVRQPLYSYKIIV